MVRKPHFSIHGTNGRITARRSAGCGDGWPRRGQQDAAGQMAVVVVVVVVNNVVIVGIDVDLLNEFTLNTNNCHDLWQLKVAMLLLLVLLVYVVSRPLPPTELPLSHTNKTRPIK